MQYDNFFYGCRIWRNPHAPYEIYDRLTYFQLKDLLSKYNGASYFIIINSEYLNGLHIPFFDYDCDSEDEVLIAQEKKEKLLLIQSKMQTYHLDGFLYETLHGYHLILNDLYEFNRYVALMEHMECCSGFKHFTKQRHYASLRLTPKPNREKDTIQFLGRINASQNNVIHSILLDFFETRNKIISMDNSINA